MQFWVAFGGNSNTSTLDSLLDFQHYNREYVHVHRSNSIMQNSAMTIFN